MKSLVVCKRIRAESTEIGTGAVVALDRATSPIIKLLQRKYREDKTYLEGDTAYLFNL
ncbi:MAG: hypothetical protein ACRBFS_14195 [Aureispira sp.]